MTMFFISEEAPETSENESGSDSEEETREESDSDWSPDSPLSTREEPSVIVERIRGRIMFQLGEYPFLIRLGPRYRYRGTDRKNKFNYWLIENNRSCQFHCSRIPGPVPGYSKPV